MIDMTNLQNLQFIFLDVSTIRTLEDQFNAGLSSMIHSFDNHRVQKSIKQLTLFVQASLFSSWKDIGIMLGSCNALGVLDRVLSNASSTFERCSIFIVADYPGRFGHYVDDEGIIAVRSQLPRLQERGVLSITFGSSPNPREAAWATVKS